jgi:hypothetical protein
MLARIPGLHAARAAAGAAFAARVVPVAFAVLALSACARRPAMCSRACDDGFACVSGECLRAATVPDVEALDRFGLYQARRLVITPVDIVRLAPGDTQGYAPRVATLGRERDRASVLLLRFAIDLPPESTILSAHVVLDRAPSSEADPSPIALHAARITQAWDARSIAWGRAPLLEDARTPVTTIDDARASVRIDVRALVRRWGRHATDDQGIGIVADRTSLTGVAFALADGGGATDDRTLVLPVRRVRDTPPTFHAAAEATEGPPDPVLPRGPRLEIYVKP